MTLPEGAIATQEAMNAAPDIDSAYASALGIESDAAETTAPAAGAEEVRAGEEKTGTAADGTQQTDTTKTADGTQQAAVDEWAVSAAITELAKTNADVQKLVEQYGKLNGYREHWTLDEAKEIKGLAPGGMTELKGLVERAVAAKAESAEFASGDAARQAVVLQGLAKDMPEAYAAGAKPYLETLKAINPQTYREVGMGLAKDALEADGVIGLLDTLFTAAKALDKDDVTDAEVAAFQKPFKELAEWFGKTGFEAKPAGKKDEAQAKLPPEAQRAIDENKQFREAENKRTLETFNTFNEGRTKLYDDAVKAELAPLFDALPKNGPAKVREALVERLQNEILRDLRAKLNADTDLKDKVFEVTFGAKSAAILSAGKDRDTSKDPWRTAPDRVKEQASNLEITRAKQLLPAVAKAVLEPFSEKTVAENNEKNDKAAAAAARTDVRGGGSGNTKPRGALTKEGLQEIEKKRGGARLSEEEILDL